MPTIALSTGTLHYSDQGNGTPLILLHANPGDSSDFDGVIPALSKQFRVLAIDWPGYGHSDIPPHPDRSTVLLYYRVLQEFIASLSLPPAWIMGNSIGGNVAARLAAQAPESVLGVVLISPGGFTPHNFVTRMFCRLQGSRLSLPPRLFASLYLKHKNPLTQAMLARAGTLQSEPARLQVNRAMWRSFASPENDLRDIARSIDVPVLLMFGKYDPAISAKKDGAVAAGTIPNAKYVEMPCGHAPFAETPDHFLEVVEPFMSAANPCLQTRAS